MSLRCLRFYSAGESHGPMLVGILEGLPAGLNLDLDALDHDLKRRMGGHGRGKRMKIERDTAELVGGVRKGTTLGSPIAFLIRNHDWPNWQRIMAVAPEPAQTDQGADAVAETGDRTTAPDPRLVTRPRPGHADLAGGLKYDRVDLRDILERASARETATRVAAGALCRQFLGELGVRIASHVVRIGPAAVADAQKPVTFDDIVEHADDSSVRCADHDGEQVMIAAIDAAYNDLDTLGGTFEVVATGVPPGLGSHIQWDRKLEGRLAQAMLSIQAQKGIEVGRAVWAASQPGSCVHDPILWDEQAGAYSRASNNAGGTEGGMSCGGELRVNVHMKPLSTLRKPLLSVDIRTRKPIDATVQRSDVCAVPAAAVVGEAMMALVLADAFLEKFGGDSLRETRRNLNGYLTQIHEFPGGH